MNAHLKVRGSSTSDHRSIILAKVDVEGDEFFLVSVAGAFKGIREERASRNLGWEPLSLG